MEPITWVKLWVTVLTVCNPLNQECEVEIGAQYYPSEATCEFGAGTKAVINKANGFYILGDPKCEHRWLSTRPIGLIETCTLSAGKEPSEDDSDC